MLIDKVIYIVFIFMGKFMIRKIFELVLFKIIERNVSIVFDGVFLM